MTKPVITDIKYDTKNLQILQERLANSKVMNMAYRKDLIRKYGGSGYCYGCDGLPTIKVMWDVSSPGDEGKSWYVQKWCKDCYDKQVLLTATNCNDHAIALKVEEN